MNFSHYSERPPQLAVDLVNTDETDGDEIATLADLRRFLEDFDDLRPPSTDTATESELVAIHALRDKLRQVFDAGDEPTAMRHLNDILAGNEATVLLSMHDSEPPHLHYEPVSSSVASWLAAITATALAGVMVEHGISRFGSCQASNCRDVFVDTTRNRSRIHCGSTCSTREAVAAYRRRQATRDHPGSTG
jgi:predicted RNA-binding Zn ribbon-like protein